MRSASIPAPPFILRCRLGLHQLDKAGKKEGEVGERKGEKEVGGG